MSIASTLDQPYQLAAAIYLGILSGIIYTVFRSICVFFKKPWMRIAVGSMCAVLCAALILAGLYFATSFRIRAYHILGISGGFLAFTLCVIPLLKYIKSKLCRIRLELKQKRKYNRRK